MKIAIVIPTYQRKDGSTKRFLEQALISINNQNYKDYKVFLIGDNYEDNNEFIKLSKIIPKDKIKYVNLPIAIEREKYTNNPTVLWNCGGVNACNYGVNLSLEEGFDFIAHLDHDDVWYDDHLELINNVIETKINVSFIYTLSNYVNNSVLPNLIPNNEVIHSLPMAQNIIHSSVCINFKMLKSRYRDMFETNNIIYPSDGDLFNNISTEITSKNYNSFLIKKITCSHILENH